MALQWKQQYGQHATPIEKRITSVCRERSRVGTMTDIARLQETLNDSSEYGGGKNLLREADSGPLGMFWEFSRNVPSLGAFTHAYRRGSLGGGTPILTKRSDNVGLFKC